MHRRALARPIGLLAALGLLAGCSGAEPGDVSASETASDVAATSPEPAPSPTPAPLAAVEGVVELTALHLETAGQRLYPAGHPGDEPPPVDEAAVHTFVGQVADRLDAHLEALQRGESSDLAAALASESGAAGAAVTSALADPDQVVASALYTTEVAVDGAPRWAHVTITVTHPDGSTASADVVFVATEAGPELVAAGPVGGSA